MGLSRILITGGAGFVGSTLALALKRDLAAVDVVAFDNLKRRGAELSLPRLKAAGASFIHGDVRSPEDFDAAGACDLIIDCAAEPSVHAGYGGSPAYVINANLLGTIHCLEHARRHGAGLIFLSSSRVYPIAGLRALPLEAAGDRLAIPASRFGPGWSEAGISETFPMTGSRSLYGASKLAAELVAEEYRAMYGLKTVINRCGVISGPWQMGKVDQGVVVLWMARHVFGGRLAYTGFGGDGRQVRDVLHIDDLYDLLRLQMADLDRHSGSTYNVGGGVDQAISLRELTAACRRFSGRQLEIGADTATREADVPYYVSDNRAVEAATGWRPLRPLDKILQDIHEWLTAHRQDLAPLLSA